MKKIRTVRDEIAARLKVYWRVYKKFPTSYNATLGIGRVPKGQDRPFSGWSLNNKRYVDGIEQSKKNQKERMFKFTKKAKNINICHGCDGDDLTCGRVCDLQ